jgi:hypothetical protein
MGYVKQMEVPDDPAPTLPRSFYLTREQVGRISALAIDALVGVQVDTDEDDATYALVSMVPIDDTSRTEHYTVYTDGSYSPVEGNGRRPRRSRRTT